MTTQNHRNCSSAFPNTYITNRAVRDVFELLARGEGKLCNQRVFRDAILVLGNTGAGKSAFTRTIAGYDASLKSVEENFYYTIKNPYNENDGKSFVTSSTIFPEQVPDINNTGIAYYDFPGFQDTRGMAYDITTTYFIKKIVSGADRVKLLFLVNYTSLTNAGTRDDFTTLLSHIMKFVRNIEKYQGGIALIATKVQLPNISDEQIISVVAKFIETVKQNLEKEEDNPTAALTIKLLDILLQRDGNTYPKIAIFRSPDTVGYLRDIPKMQENILHLKTKVAKLKFVEKTDTDFGYTIAKQSLIDVDKIIKEIARSFTATVQEMGKEIERYLSAEQDQFNDIFKLYNLTSVRYDELRKIKERANNQEKLDKCTLEIVNGAASMDINLPTHCDMLIKFDNYSSFLHEVSDHAIQNQFKCADGMQDVIEHINKSKKWYHFLNKLYERLSDYEIQKNTQNNPCTALTENVAEAIENEKKSEFNFDQIVLKKCYPDYESTFENDRNMTVDKAKLNFLKTVLKSGLQNNISHFCDSNKLVIKGKYIKLGDVPDIEKRGCKVPPKFIEIFALSKIFINADLDKTGDEVQLTIVAPVWDIQGSRKIKLDGASGKAHYPEKARDDKSYFGKRGTDGLPGLPGGPAGNFVGIGDSFKNMQELTISVRGGDGGPGQEGGDGINGKNGADAYNDIRLIKNTLDSIASAAWLSSIASRIESAHHTILKSRATATGYEVTLAGKLGQKGGDGGNGGKGGLGGDPGEIIFMTLTSSDNNHINKVTGVGNEGSGGKGGMLGFGGKHGNNLEIFEPSLLGLFRRTETKKIKITKTAANGNPGEYGYNDFHREQPKQSKRILNPRVVLNEYKNYIGENKKQSESDFYSSAFLQKLESVEHLLNRRRRRRYIDSTDETFDINREKGHEKNIKNLHSSSDSIAENKTENSRLSRDQSPNKINPVADDFNVAKNAGFRINSPINFAINLFSDFFGQLKTFTSTNIMAFELVKSGIECMFSEPTSSDNPLTLGRVDINESLTLADFAIRCITKQKIYNSGTQSINFSEIRAFVISVVTEFEEMLSDISVKYNLPLGSLEFDPVALMSKLEKEMINQNYKKVVQALYQSVESNPHLDNLQLRTQILHNLNKAMCVYRKQLMGQLPAPRVSMNLPFHVSVSINV